MRRSLRDASSSACRSTLARARRAVYFRGQMKIFLSYASQDRAQVESIHQALAAEGHDIFFDREDLPPGEAYDSRIRQAIESCDLFIVILSPDTVDAGSYTLNEIDFARKVHANPSGRVLPVMLRPTPFESIPAYLKAVTLLQTDGNVPAAVTEAVHRLSRRKSRRVLIGSVAAMAIVAIAAFAFYRFRVANELTGRDGAPAVLIPAGKVVMGDDFLSPLREVYVDAFYIDAVELTVARYAKFLQATGSLQPPEGWSDANLERDAQLPVAGVSWRDADAYCRWAERRLPTEAEWERAARSDDARLYPWGKDEPTAQHANFGKDSAANAYQGGLTAVAQHSAGASPFGVQDMAGNVSEWVADWFTESFSSEDVRNPQGPATGTQKVGRGGGWYDPSERIRVSRRFYADPDLRSDDLGFRCARDAG